MPLQVTTGLFDELSSESNSLAYLSADLLINLFHTPLLGMAIVFRMSSYKICLPSLEAAIYTPDSSDKDNNSKSSTFQCLLFWYKYVLNEVHKRHHQNLVII